MTRPKAQLKRKPVDTEIETWSIQDLSCKKCGGRILRREGGPAIATGGGNPIYRCADCGVNISYVGPEVICWCGFHYRHKMFTAAWRCQS